MERGDSGTVRMTKLQVITRLWSHITDLFLLLDGRSAKTRETIEKEIDLTGLYCREYTSDTEEE